MSIDPRWASWNLGIFICIRCSGIHRGMGTHISRVKSVDLDSWTDEQMQSILSWGNARANKYWEAKLAPGHSPSEAKIENFIRTKYELKRWAMEGPVPDPATLGADGDDEVPLSIVKEKQAIDRKETARKEPAQFDLIGGSDPEPARQAAPPPATKAAPAPPKATTTKDSLLGLDFLGESSAPPRPASTPGSTGTTGQSRPDLKQSILSLYASAPKAPAQPQQNIQQQSGFGNTQQPQGSVGGFTDAFSGLSLSNTTSPKPVAADPFASFGSSSASSKPAAPQASNNSFGGLSGGGFFDTAPVQASAPTTHQAKPSSSGFSDFGGFASAPAPAPVQSKPVQSSSAMGDLFDLSAPFSQSSPPPVNPTSPPSSSVFNLSQPKPTPVPVATSATASVASGADVWGDNAWGSPAAAPAAPVAKSPVATKAAPAASADFGWGTGGGFASTPIVPGAGGGFNPAPKVTADEEFGTWTSSTGGTASSTTATAGANQSGGKQGGFGGDDDLFSNVWQ